jgi:DNA replication protein DnaC
MTGPFCTICDDVGSVQAEQRRLKTAAEAVPENYRHLAWDRAPMTELATGTKRVLRGYVKNYERYRREGHGLWLSGPIGVGKTSAAALIHKDLAEQHAELRRDVHRRDARGQRIMGFWSCDKLLRRLRASFAEDSELDAEAVHEQLCQLELLVIDDLKAPRHTDWSRGELYGLINTRYENRLPTIFTADVDEATLRADLGDRTIDRLVERCKPIEVKRAVPSENGYRHYVDPVDDTEDWEQPASTYGRPPAIDAPLRS